MVDVSKASPKDDEFKGCKNFAIGGLTVDVFNIFACFGEFEIQKKTKFSDYDL